MTLWTDEVSRISTRQLRGQFKPAEFARLAQVTLAHGDARFVVALERAKGHGCIVRERVWFKCNCGALAVTIAIGYSGVGCRACTPWRARGYARSRVMAPHVGPIRADAAARDRT